MANQDSALLGQTVRQIGRGLLFGLALSFFVNLLMLSVPLYTMQIYDRVMTSHSIDTLMALASIIIGALVLYGVLDYLRSRLFLIAGDRLARHLNVPTLKAALVDALRGGTGNSGQAIRDLNDLRTFLTGSAITVPLELAWTPVFLIVLFLLHPVYGWIAIGAATILFGLSLVTDLLTRRPLGEANDAAARSFGDIAATVRHAEAIEAMGMLPAVVRRWQRTQNRMIDRLNRGNDRAKALAALSKTVRLIMQVAMLSAGAMLVIDRQATPGSMMAASILMGRMLLPFEQLIDGWRQWVFSLSAFRRVRGLLADASSGRQTMPLPRPEGRLVVDRLVYIPPGSDRAVLKNVSFSLEPGEVLGIIGPSAAGKSTLARLLVGIWEPTAGGIYLDGHSTFQWERESFGCYVGYLPQSVSLLDGTVRENIARMAEADPHDVVRAARMAGVHEMIGRLPFGYDTPVGESAYSLSGGQRQRIALARALFGEPRLLVLDEPNASLDHAGEQALIEAITAAKQSGATVVLIAHRPSIISVVDKVLVMKDGAVDQFGPRTDIIKTVAPPGGATVTRLVTSGDPR